MPRFSGFQHLRTSPETKFGGEVERRRSGVREGGGRAWETARIALVWLQMLHLPVK